MSSWRRKAIEAFPEKRHWIERFAFNATWFFATELLPIVHEARAHPDPDRLRRAFDFAAWCLHQRRGGLSGVVAVAFYEHLFDHREDWETVIAYLAPDVIAVCWPVWEARWKLWESRSSAEDVQRLRGSLMRRMQGMRTDGEDGSRLSR